MRPPAAPAAKAGAAGKMGMRDGSSTLLSSIKSLPGRSCFAPAPYCSTESRRHVSTRHLERAAQPHGDATAEIWSPALDRPLPGASFRDTGWVSPERLCPRRFSKYQPHKQNALYQPFALYLGVISLGSPARLPAVLCHRRRAHLIARDEPDHHRVRGGVGDRGINR